MLDVYAHSIFDPDEGALYYGICTQMVYLKFKFFKANSTQPTNLKGRLQVMIGTCVQPKEIKVVPHCTQV